MLVECMLGVNSIRSGWRCESCAGLISDLQSGWVEWIAAEGVNGKLEVSGLRLVHFRKTSPRSWEPCGCQYNPRDEFRRNGGIVEGLPLDRFAGPDGLMLVLSMIAEPVFPVEELIELAKRVLIPGYEAASELIHDAISEAVIAPATGGGFYLQSEICDVLEWAKHRTSANTGNFKYQNRCVVSH